MGTKQLTFQDVDGIEKIPGLSDTQRKILSLLNHNNCQATIAQRIHKSRSYVNQTVKKWESKGLIKAKDYYPDVPGKRSYTKFYELSPALKQRIAGDKIAEPFTSCRIHNIRMKISIISLSAPISLDKRTGYSKSWTMRGGPRHKFWFSGKAGMPSCTLDIHPRTIVCYIDRKQHIIAKDPTEAMDIGWRTLYAAVDKFIEQQLKFNVVIETAHTGQVIGKPHGGFVGSDSPVMDAGVTEKNWWIDRSQEAELGPGHPELETTDKVGMTRLDNLIKVSEQVDLTALPEMFKGMLDPLNANVMQVQAMMQGSITNQQMLENVTKLISSVLIEMQSIRAENAELKARLG